MSMIGTIVISYRPPFQVKTIDASDRETFMSFVRALRTPKRENKLHMHEQHFSDHQPDAHMLNDCLVANHADLRLANPRLFDGTFMKNGQLWVAFGWVAAQEDN